MAIVYEDRPELMMTSKVASRLYFAALAVTEDFERLVTEDVLFEMEIESLARLQRAIEDYQGEELTANGNTDQD